jgi:hypothetical protein
LWNFFLIDLWHYNWKTNYRTYTLINMKRILITLGIGLILVSGCKKIVVDTIQPISDFNTSNTLLEPFENVYFTNLSTDADSYTWDFGDGSISYDANPTHSYTSEGSYYVTLRADRNNGKSDVSSITIDVYFTKLEVTVAEWNINYYYDNLIYNAQVTLYPTYDDWKNLTNAIAIEYTDSYGVAYFTGLHAREYYVDVYKINYDNETLGLGDVNYVWVPTLYKSETNTFTAWVYYTGLKAATNSRIRNTTVKSTEIPVYRSTQKPK